MATSAQKRAWWADWRCNTQRMVRVPFPGVDRTWNLLVADTSVPAWLRFVDLMEKHGYLFRESAGGTYNCRRILNDPTKPWSLHAYGIAVDLNPSKNPYGTRRHNFPQGFIDDVLATGLFRWGIEFDDPMHWEINVPPDQIPDYLEEEDMSKFGPASWDDADRKAFRETFLLSPIGKSKLNFAQHIQNTHSYVKQLWQRPVSGVEVDEEAIVAAVVDALEEDGIAQATADELDRRARERLGG